MLYLSLRYLIEKAKKEQVLADVIKRVIYRVNRMVSIVRNAFTKPKGKIGALGGISYMYDHLLVIIVKEMLSF